MPQVQADQQAQVTLNQLLRFPRHEWDRHLHEFCTPDAEVRQQVERLIREFDAAPEELPDVPATNFGVLDSENALITFGTTQANVAVSGRGLPLFEADFELGRFRILCLLGEGGFGIVYAAREHLQDDKTRLVALKFVKEREGLDQEMKIQSHFHHPNIVEVFDSASVGLWHFIVMELISSAAYSDESTVASSRTLIDEVANSGMPARRAAALTLQISNAIAAAHSVRIVHLDIKPANVLLTPSNDAKVSDFSLSAQIHPDRKCILVPGATVGFAAPEQLSTSLGLDRLVDTRSDIFGIGATLYYILTGEPIFKARHKSDRLQEYRDFFLSDPEKKLSPSDVQPRLPTDLVTICSKCLATQPSGRYQSAPELSADLERFLKHEPLSGASLRRRVLLAVRRNRIATAVVTALIGFGIFMTARVTYERDRYFVERNRFQESSREAFGLTSDVLESLLDSKNSESLRSDLRGQITSRIKKLDELVQQTPDELTSMRTVAKAHMLQGMEFFEADQFEEAIEEYDTAVLIMDRTIVTAPDKALKWLERGGTLESKALVLIAIGKADVAKQIYELALSDYREAAIRDPKFQIMVTTTEEFLANYPAFVIENVNGWMMSGRYQVAAIAADEAIRLVNAAPAIPEEARSETIGVVSHLRDAALKVKQSLENPESALEEPIDEQVVILTAICRETARNESPLKGRVDLAKRAIATLERAVKLNPGLASGTHDNYNIACAYARAFQGAKDLAPNEAVSFYEAAIGFLIKALGDPQLAEAAQTDEDLDSIVETMNSSRFQGHVEQ